jgi:hypothetical protein
MYLINQICGTQTISKSETSTTKKVFSVIAFAIAMGFLEAAVVVYIRALYYPEGFSFPMVVVPFSTIGVVEIWREAATIVMLAGIGFLAGKNNFQRFAYFMLSFGIWDIFYYIFLNVTLHWPVTIFEWDILFLIPLPWTGPVWAPCLISLYMCGTALYVIYKVDKGFEFNISKSSFFTFILGCSVCVYSFVHEFIVYSKLDFSTSIESLVFQKIVTFIPTNFPLEIFIVGFSIMLFSFYLLIKSNKK